MKYASMESFDSLFKAAKSGDALAEKSLGDAYAQGDGTVFNVKKAAEWYQRSAEHGDAEALGSLGYCRLCGDSAARDPKEAVRLIKEAIERGLRLKSLMNCSRRLLMGATDLHLTPDRPLFDIILPCGF